VVGEAATRRWTCSAASPSTRFQDTTAPARVLHRVRRIDGAFFFVALSGFVIGLDQRRVVERSRELPTDSAAWATGQPASIR
jgi:hypothetical protein